MGKQSKPRKIETFGKGKVTPTQIAFIVDRYLCDNNYPETRSIFRNEASSLIANSPLQEAPKTLLSLGEMLDEYICLKEQKVILDQEKVRMDQEKYRVQMLLQGMQNVMNAYNASGNPSGSTAPNLPAPAAKSVVNQPQITTNKSPSGIPTPMQSAMNVQTRPQSTNTQAEVTPMVNPSKRKDPKAMDAPIAAKKTRGRSSARKIPSLGPNTLPQSENAVNNQVAQTSCAVQSSSDNGIPNGTQVQGSSVAKCLFNEPSHSIPSNSPILNTPPRANSSHSDTHVSPPEISSAANCNISHASREINPTRCTVISTKRVMVSPAKQMAYIERRHCISPLKPGSEKTSKREHVRSRLDFDGSDMPESLDRPLLSNDMSTSESDRDMDLFDIDFPNFDALGMDFSFTDMLGELDLHCEGVDFSGHPTSYLSEYNASGPSNQFDQTNQVMSELSPSAAVLSEKEMSIQGPDCLTAMKSVTKCITILSPAKNRQHSLNQEDPRRD